MALSYGMEKEGRKEGRKEGGRAQGAGQVRGDGLLRQRGDRCLCSQLYMTVLYGDTSSPPTD